MRPKGEAMIRFFSGDFPRLLVVCLIGMVVCAGICAVASQQETADVECIKCHNPIKLAMQKKVRHAAVEKGCASCHIDHRQVSPLDRHKAGAAPSYLKAAQPQVCLECHAASKKDLGAVHRGQPFLQAECTSCHDPHSSNSPKLLPEVSHGPSGARQCSTCHVTREAGKMKLAAADMDALCYGCHEEIKKRIEGSKSRHKLLSLERTSCLECHNPHATNQKYLLKKPAQALCSGCHLDLTSGRKYVHGPVELSCVVCHDPHASDVAKDLRAAGNDLCMDCHGMNAARIQYSKAPFAIFGGRVSLPPGAFESLPFIELSEDGKKGHPTPAHPVYAAATGEKAELNCLTFHTPHASADKKLLKRDKGSLCLSCHNK
jgi:predicted CXXCH cytochrome family protein